MSLYDTLISRTDALAQSSETLQIRMLLRQAAAHLRIARLAEAGLRKGPALQRQIIDALRAEGFRQSEIARVLGISEGLLSRMINKSN